MISLAKFPSFLVVIKKMTAPVERMTGDGIKKIQQFINCSRISSSWRGANAQSVLKMWNLLLILLQEFNEIRFCNRRRVSAKGTSKNCPKLQSIKLVYTKQIRTV